MEKVIVFDFDGTLVQGESFFPFLSSINKWGLFRSFPELVTYPFHKDRLKLKEAMMAGAIQGRAYEEICHIAEQFYQDWVVPRLKNDVVKELVRHQREGYRTVLVSANITPIILAAKKGLHFDEHLCSELELDKEGKITGKLSSPNCRGEEKVHRLKSFFDGEQVVVEAYGNSEGDRELLLWADIPHWVK